MTKSYAGVILAGSLIIAGCSEEKSVPPPAPVATPAAAPDMGLQPTATSSATPPPVAPPTTAATANTPAVTTAVVPKFSGPALLEGVDKDYIQNLINVNNAYQEFRSSQMRSPRDLTEIISSGRLKELPPAPPGKRYFIDEPNLRVILIKE